MGFERMMCIYLRTDSRRGEASRGGWIDKWAGHRVCIKAARNEISVCLKCKLSSFSARIISCLNVLISDKISEALPFRNTFCTLDAIISAEGCYEVVVLRVQSVHAMMLWLVVVNGSLVPLFPEIRVEEVR